jgi:replicative DNA helicase
VIQLETDVPRKPDTAGYIRTLKAKALARRLAALAYDDQQRASDPSQDPHALLEAAIEARKGLLDSGSDADLQSVGDYLKTQGEPKEMFRRMATRNGIRLGMAQLDDLTLGLLPGQLWVVAGRPEMGKSAIADMWAHHTSVRSLKSTALFTLEQPTSDVIRRMLSQQSNIPHRDIQMGTLKEYQRDVLLDHRTVLQNAPLYIDETTGLTVTRIWSKLSRLQRKVGLDIVFIDQLSHISRADVYQRGMPKHEQVGEQSRKLKLMAKELNVPVVLFNQISREAAKRTDPRPKKEDLAESGSLEQDADGIVLLFRPEVYDRANLDLRGKAELILAKQRQGDTGTLQMRYDGPTLRWIDESAPVAQQASFLDAEDEYKGAF